MSACLDLIANSRVLLYLGHGLSSWSQAQILLMSLFVEIPVM